MPALYGCHTTLEKDTEDFKASFTYTFIKEGRPEVQKCNQSRESSSTVYLEAMDGVELLWLLQPLAGCQCLQEPELTLLSK